MQQSVLCYRAAHSALLAANLERQDWEDRLKDLKDSDVQGPGKDDFYFQEAGKATYGGRYEISWIWLVPQSKSEIDRNSSKQVFDEGLQVEWSKSQARKMRWEEEVQIIQEEMRRTIVYYEWKQQWWLGQNPQPTISDNPAWNYSLFTKASTFLQVYGREFRYGLASLLASKGH